MCAVGEDTGEQRGNTGGAEEVNFLILHIYKRIEVSTAPENAKKSSV